MPQKNDQIKKPIKVIEKVESTEKGTIVTKIFMQGDEIIDIKVEEYGSSKGKGRGVGSGDKQEQNTQGAGKERRGENLVKEDPKKLGKKVLQENNATPVRIEKEKQGVGKEANMDGSKNKQSALTPFSTRPMPK
jgi:hypothetical protein